MSETTWNIRDLNIEQSDPDSIVSISDDEFLPVARTYTLNIPQPPNVKIGTITVYKGLPHGDLELIGKHTYNCR